MPVQSTSPARYLFMGILGLLVLYLPAVWAKSLPYLEPGKMLFFMMAFSLGLVLVLIAFVQLIRAYSGDVLIRCYTQILLGVMVILLGIFFMVPPAFKGPVFLPWVLVLMGLGWISVYIFKVKAAQN